MKEIKDYLEYNPETGEIHYSQNHVNIKKGTRAGWKEKSGYRKVEFGKQRWMEHQLAFLLSGLAIPDIIDHINGVKDDNRLCNLRGCSKSENACNSKTPSNNTTGVKGVSFNKINGKYRAYVVKDGIEYRLGHFNTAEGAAWAVVEKRKELHGEFYNGGDF